MSDETRAGHPRPPAFIAEVSSNHNCDLNRCLTFIETAAQIGCAAVKFQLFRIQELFAPEVLARSPAHQERKQWELPLEFLPELASHCRKLGISFGCTPFYLEAVEQLAPYVDFYKVASYELLWNPLLAACAHTAKPVILSTGMATIEEITNAVGTLRQHGCASLTLLHCVSGYPTPVPECNLRAIETLRKTFRCPVGWSDHTVDPAVVCRAVHRWDAATIEFHLDLDGRGKEFAAGHCWLPDQMAAVIRSTRATSAADGDGVKEPAPSEQSDRGWRADPSDGLRPLKHLRETFRG